MIDIVILIMLVLLAEVSLLRNNYKGISPVIIFVASFVLIYLLPLFFYQYVPSSKLNLLREYEIDIAKETIRIFIYTWSFTTFILMFRLGNLKQKKIIYNYKEMSSRVKKLLPVAILITIIFLGAGVGFSPTTMLNRILDPRHYTYIKSGMGPLIHLRLGLLYVLIMMAAMLVVIDKKSIKSRIILIGVIFLSLLGGGKASLMIPFLIIFIVYMKLKPPRGILAIKLYKMFMVQLFLVFLLMVSFSLLRKSGEHIPMRDIAYNIIEYQQEVYFLPKVISIFDWSPVYIYEAILSSIIAPIPRIIWSSKPYVGLYNIFWRPVFESKSVQYHTSTYGCLSEAHMLFGSVGPAVYGLVFALLVYWLYKTIISSHSLVKFYVAIFLHFWLYLFLRAGFTGTTFSVVIIYIMLGYALIPKDKTSLSIRRHKIDPKYG